MTGQILRIIADALVDIADIFAAHAPQVADEPFYTPAPVAVCGVELDKHGIPWDSRIHSASRAKNQDETWRLKRGVAPIVIEQVKAELKAAILAPASPTDPAPPELAPSAGVTTFVEFVQSVTRQQAAGKITVQEVNDACARHGLAQMPLLVNRVDLIPTIYAELEAVWNTRG